MSHPLLFFDHSELVGRALSESCAPSGPLEHQREIRVEDYNLPLTLLTSYACYFYAPVVDGAGIQPSHWAGVVPKFSGINVAQVSQNTVVVGSESPIPDDVFDLVLDSLGLYRGPFQPPAGLDGLFSKYPGIRLPRLRKNLLDLLVAILCSGHATISKGRQWFLFLKQITQSLQELADLDPGDLMQRTRQFCQVSMGYRARYVVAAVQWLSSEGRSAAGQLESLVEGRDPEVARRDLLAIPFVGPKTADCFLLNGLGTSYVPPVDVHVLRVSSRVKFFETPRGLPIRELCRTYVCDPRSENACPLSKAPADPKQDAESVPFARCLRSDLKQSFEDAGWVQAVLFVHGLSTCRAQEPSCPSCGLADQGACIGPLVTIKRVHGVGVARRAPVEVTAEIVLPQTIVEFYPEAVQPIKDTVKDLDKRAREAGVSFSRKEEIPALVWISSRVWGIPLTIQEASSHYGLTKSRLFKRAKAIATNLDITLPVVESKHYTVDFGRKLGLADGPIQEAVALGRLLEGRDLNPLPLALACLRYTLMAKGETGLARELRAKAQISDVTVRKYHFLVTDALAKQIELRVPARDS